VEFLEDCCRVCAQRNSALISIFGEEGLFRQLITKLRYCLQIIVLENDGLPTTICWKCLSKLEISFELLQERIRGENEFRRLNLFNQVMPLAWENSEVKMEEDNTKQHMESPTRDESTSDTFRHSTTPANVYHQEPPCQCEHCTTRYKWLHSMKTDDDSEQSTSVERLEVPTPSDEQLSTSSTASRQSPCNCEQCISQYGALPLLAEVIDRTNTSIMSGSSHQQSSPSNPTQQDVSEVLGPIRGLKKTISCEFCGKIFGHTGDLNKHRRKHTGERPYPCTQCSKRFSHASNLLRHQKIHSGEMPHECPICAKKFSRKDKMMNHFKNSHKSKSESQSSV
ncbi:hypothetical protein L9F63_006325, partial [Diploptera punctata]